MAVEARHLNLFPPQILTNRQFAMNGVQGHGSLFGAPIAPVTAAETEIAGWTFPAGMKCNSGLTYASISRKRSREAVNSLHSPFHAAVNSDITGGGFTFLGEDISFQFQQQQLEIDRFIAQHTEKVRIEIEERRRRYSRRIAAAAEDNMMNTLKAREEEIHKIGKLNYALEERVKSLCAENQVWRDLAQSNEATANSLRSNLEQVLAHRRPDFADDANSCCGSNSDEDDRRTPAAGVSRLCRSCEREESCVLLLPCRHLCLCTNCGSTLHTCPVCNATKTASVHVNL